MSLLPAYSWRSYHPAAQLRYITDADQANIHLAALDGPVGFDLEWKPTFVKGAPENPVAVVQLANSESILVIQISSMQRFPEKLRDFLENPNFVKAGVAIQNDVKKLYRDCRVSVRNCVDLSLLARSVDNAQWKGKYNTSLGLARLVEAYESLGLPKGKISRTNWERRLSPPQIEYAGNDAHAGFIVYQRLMTIGQSMDEIPNPIYFSFDAVQGSLYQPSGLPWSPHNPDYDPGPPPPPKQPKATPSIEDGGSSLPSPPGDLPAQTMSNPSPVSSHKTRHRFRARHRHGLASNGGVSPTNSSNLMHTNGGDPHGRLPGQNKDTVT